MLNKLQTANRSTIATLAILFAIVLFLAINLITSLTLTLARVDATENHLYTLSSDTRDTLDSLTDPVTLRLYLSTNIRDENPSVRLYSDRVIELLRTYEALSGGLVNFEQIKPTELSVEEEEATGFGIEAVTSTGGAAGYFGLVGTNSIDGLEIIPYLNPADEPSLEYDLTRMIRRLSSRTEITIGVIDGLALTEPSADTGLRSTVIENLDVDFALYNVALDFTVLPDPSELHAIVVIHPFALSANSLYAIDQYVIRGGRALIFLDSQAELSSPMPNNPRVLQFPDSDLEPLLSHWGVRLVPDRIVGDPNLALQVQMRETQEMLRYLPYMVFTADGGNFNLTDPVTSPLSQLRLSSPGALEDVPGAGTTVTPLIYTTDGGGQVDQSITMARDPSAILLNFEPMGRQVVAVRITGDVTTAYPDGPPPPAVLPQGAQEPAPPPPLQENSSRPVNILVVADTDMLGDTHMSPDMNNDDFVTNAVESLVGETTLTELRVRGRISRPFTYINQIEEDATATYAADIERGYAELEQVALSIDNIISRVPGGQIIALPQGQQQELANLRQRQQELLRQVRSLESSRRAEINSVITNLRLMNILIVPGVIILLGLLVALWRRIRLARYVRRWRSTV